MKNEGLALGYLAMMLFMGVIVDRTPLWWTIELIGLSIMTIIWIILDRKEFKRLLNNVNWGKFGELYTKLSNSFNEWLRK
jgi:hypothetical protein